jgi:hypothetical protein
VADPVRVLSRIVPPDIDSTRPSTWSLPTGGGGGAGGGAPPGAGPGGAAVTVAFPGLLFFAASSEWHMATLSAMTATTATSAIWASRGLTVLADTKPEYPLGARFTDP